MAKGFSGPPGYAGGLEERGTRCQIAPPVSLRVPSQQTDPQSLLRLHFRVEEMEWGSERLRTLRLLHRIHRCQPA